MRASTHDMTNRRGVILIFVLLILVALMGVALAFWYAINSEIRSAGAGLANAQAFYIAEAGRAKARYELTTGGQAPPYSETDVTFGKGAYSYTATVAGNLVTITSDGYVPDSGHPVAQRRVVESNIAQGGGNLSIGCAVDASATQGGNDASRAIDGNSNSKWISSTNGGSWLRLNYGSAKTVARVVVDGSKIDTCVVQYSNNGSSWTSVSGSSGSLPGTQTFNPVTAQYLRLSITGNKPQVNEFESYAGSGAESVLGQGKFGTSL